MELEAAAAYMEEEEEAGTLGAAPEITPLEMSKAAACGVGRMAAPVCLYLHFSI